MLEDPADSGAPPVVNWRTVGKRFLLLVAALYFVPVLLAAVDGNSSPLDRLGIVLAGPIAAFIGWILKQQWLAGVPRTAWVLVCLSPILCAGLIAFWSTALGWNRRRIGLASLVLLGWSLGNVVYFFQVLIPGAL